MERLYTPWRYEYVVSDHATDGCVFCSALEAGEDRQRLIILRARHNFVLLNRYPYSNGHLLVAPNRHLARLADSSRDELHELMELAARCESLLGRAYSPQGINIGMNLGRSAGASMAEHYHLHLVPRWSSDTSFMTVVGDTRVIPEELEATWKHLREVLRAEDEG